MEHEIGNACPARVMSLCGITAAKEHESAGVLRLPMPEPNRLRLEPGDRVAELHVCKHCGGVYWVGEGS